MPEAIYGANPLKRTDDMPLPSRCSTSLEHRACTIPMTRDLPPFRIGHSVRARCCEGLLRACPIPSNGAKLSKLRVHHMNPPRTETKKKLCVTNATGTDLTRSFLR
jgi:hypothetical protein